MIKSFLSALLLMLFFSQAQANFLSDLFEFSSKKEEKRFEHVEEETISADEYFDTSEEPVFVEEEKVFSDDEEHLFTEDNSFIKAKNIFLSYTHQPKKVYMNQHFYIDVKAVITANNVRRIQTTFEGGSGYTISNKGASWKKSGDKSFTNRYHFKLSTSNAKLPHILVSYIDTRGNTSEVELLKGYNQKVIALKESPIFSGVLAKKFELINHHAKKYDDKNNIILLEINASDANLEDFHLATPVREGIDSLTEYEQNQMIFYFAVVPHYQKEFAFKYFNLENNKFNRISFPIITSDSSVSTQTDLNPQKSKYFLYKVVGLLSLSLILLLLFFKFRKGYLLFFALILAIYTIYSKLITNNLTLGEGIMIRILPTDNSTIFYKTSQNMEVKVLLKKNGYTKVLLPNTKIGWIKDDDLSKN